MSIEPQDRRARRIFAALLILAIGYGSLYPFNYTNEQIPPSPWLALLTQRITWTGVPDVLGNILLFAPLGALCNSDKIRQTALRVAFAAFYAYAIQVIQFWFPDRSPALSDALWNCVGIVAGLIAMHGLQAFARVPGLRPGWRGALYVLMLWLASEIAPFVPTLDIGHLKDALRPLLVFDPDPVRILALTTGIAICGECLFASFDAEQDIPLWLLALIAIWLGGKLVVETHALRWSSLIAAPCGLLLAWRVRRLRSGTRELLLAALAFLCWNLDSIFPLHLRTVPIEMNWEPFAARLSGNMLTNLDSLLLSMFQYSAIFWLLQRQGARLPVITCLMACWALALEGAQTWIEGRTADATEALLVLIAGVTVAWLSRPTKAAAR